MDFLAKSSSNSFYLLPRHTTGLYFLGYLAVRYDPVTRCKVSAFFPGLTQENLPGIILHVFFCCHRPMEDKYILLNEGIDLHSSSLWDLSSLFVIYPSLYIWGCIQRTLPGSGISFIATNQTGV